MEEFTANLWVAEVLTKLAASAVLGTIEGAGGGAVSPRSYRLSRASGGGEWLHELHYGLTEDANQLPAGGELAGWLERLRRALMQVSQRPDVDELQAVGKPLFELRCELLQDSARFRRPTPLALLRWCVEIRNKTVGHGALGAGFWVDHVAKLRKAVDYLVSAIPLSEPDLFLVVPTTKAEPIGRLLRGMEPENACMSANFEVGTAGCALGDHAWRLPALVWIRESDNQTFIANGSWRDSDRSAELMSHSIAAVDGGTSTTRRQLPTYALPPVAVTATSETEGTREFDLSGPIPHNLPPAPDGYVERRFLEDELRTILGDTAKRHLVSMRGFGGIGKTSLILRLATEMSKVSAGPYEQIVWVSARDVDLTVSGPRDVKQGQRDIEALWQLYAELWNYSESEARERFELDLADPSMATLLVMDNFETFSDQAEAYRYLDDIVQPPSKVVITSRHDFKGNFQIQVRGMEREEAAQLIRSAAREAGREGLIDEQVISRIYEKCEGHPYAMKLLAAAVETKAGLTGLLSEVFRDEGLLDALFRRSIAGVDEEAEYVFMLASRFPRGVSEVALRVATAAEDIDLDRALRALRERSLLEADDVTGLFLMPAVAREFAARLAIGHLQAVAVDDEEKYLRGWEGLVSGRVSIAGREMERAVAGGQVVRSGRRTTTVLALLAEYDQSAWLSVARALRQSGGDSSAIDDAYKRAVESSPYSSSLFDEWSDAVDDIDQKVKLKVQAVSADPLNFKLANKTAQFLNMLRAREKERYSKLAWSRLMTPVAAVLKDNLSQLDASECSSLAWLYLNLGKTPWAKQVVQIGLSVDAQNYNIKNLGEKLKLPIPENGG